MNNRALFLAAVIVVASACESRTTTTAPPPPPKVEPPQVAALTLLDIKKKYPNAKECADADCNITVTATACDKAAIKADPAELVPLKKNMTIVWKVTSPGYTFDPANGIKFKNPRQAQFTCGPGSDATVFTCKNKNDDSTVTEYDYAINLKSGSNTCATDPIIINGF